MVVKYGYAIAEQVGNMAMTTGRMVTPTKLPNVISLSVVNSSRFLVTGTKPELLEWLHTYSYVKLEVTLFDNENEAPHIHIPDVVIDLLPTLDPHHKSFIDYINPTHHPNPENEPVRLEFRPVNPKIDENIEPYFRIIVERGSTFGEIINEITTKWDSIVYPSFWDNVKHIVSLPSQYLRQEEEEKEEREEENESTNSPYNVPLNTIIIDQK